MILATILGGTTAALWILGGVLMADWFDVVEEHMGRELYLGEKLKLTVGWPLLATIIMFSSENADGA